MSDVVKKSKFLSLVLRHKPEEIGIELDKNGWTSVVNLLCATHWSLSDLDEVVTTNNKKRFEYNEGKTMIRACQGHSINVDLGLKPSIPPDTLYHGTATRFIDPIFSKGIVAGSRDMVHLSTNIETAISVGSRHGKPAVIIVNTGAMNKDRHKFYLSNNSVWLTKEVPTKYLQIKH